MTADDLRELANLGIELPGRRGLWVQVPASLLREMADVVEHGEKIITMAGSEGTK